MRPTQFEFTREQLLDMLADIKWHEAHCCAAQGDGWSCERNGERANIEWLLQGSEDD